MQKLKISTVVLVAAFSLALLSPAVENGLPCIVYAALAQDDWKTEFESICARTQDAATIASDELKSLVDRCDKLKPSIEKLDESQKKVYLKRLKMCRDLLAFVLESRENK